MDCAPHPAAGAGQGREAVPCDREALGSIFGNNRSTATVRRNTRMPHWASTSSPAPHKGPRAEPTTTVGPEPRLRKGERMLA